MLSLHEKTFSVKMSLFLVFPANASSSVMCLNPLGKKRLHRVASTIFLVEKSQDMQSSNGSFAFRIFLSIIDLLKERNSRNLKVLSHLPLIQVAKKRPHGVIFRW